VTERFDIIIIGSGAGGGTLAYALAPAGARILVLERGDFVPQEAENWSPEAVWKHRRYRARETWVDASDGGEFEPYTHYCVGGNTKFWGAVLYRLRREDFGELQHADGVSPAWPIAYEDLAPYYARAERLYDVRGEVGPDPSEPARDAFPLAAFPHEPRVTEMVERLRALGYHPSPLPLGLRANCERCATCNSYPCKVHAKSDADVIAIRPATQYPNVTLWTNARAQRLITDPAGRRVTGVLVERRGETITVEGSLVVVSCGAVNSAALLLRSGGTAHPRGLANSSGLVGRNYMAHHATMISAIGWRTNATRFQKTLAINDFYLRGPGVPYPLGQIQSQGRIHPHMIQSGAPPKLRRAARHVPLFVYKLLWTSRSMDWLAMTEDLPHRENGITLAGDRIHLSYRPSNLRPHRELVALTKRMLRSLGLRFPFATSLGSGNTTHQCGTAVFGIDPKTSVLDPFCRTHDVPNLFVVDASFFPSSAAVNPGLTIAAQALRVADHIRAHDL
jgi:choline dehydrogenase-like flavoprotein